MSISIFINHVNIYLQNIYLQQLSSRKRIRVTPEPSSTSSTSTTRSYYFEKWPRVIIDEPAARLLNPITILLGCSGYIQVGYFPDMDNDKNVQFSVRTVIALDGTNMLLDIEELANFFIAMRKEPDFANIAGGEDYFPSVEQERLVNFFFKKKEGGYIVTYFNYSKYVSYKVVIPSQEMGEHILSLEKIVNGYMSLKECFEDEKLLLASKLEDVRKECYGSPLHIKTLAENTSDHFTGEMATNLFGFFENYWRAKQD